MSRSFTRALTREGPRPPERAPWTTRLAVVGTTFRRIGVGRLAEHMLHPRDTSGRVALRDALGASELVYLATCNRIECYVVLPAVTTAGELRARLSAFFAQRGAVVREDELEATVGDAAIEHLFAVTGSLESHAVGETDIARQVRRAADDAASIGLCCATLLALFERAGACARRVQGRLAAGRAPRTVANMALEAVRSFTHQGAEGPGTTVLVGAGDAIREVARALAQALGGSRGERIFVDKHLADAEDLAAEFGGRALSLHTLVTEPLPWIDLLVTATSQSETVIPAWALGPALAARARALSRRPLIVCDLSVPRDVDPAIDHVQGVQVISIERLQHLQRATSGLTDEDLAAARKIVRGEAQRLLREERFKRIADEGARSLVVERLGHLRDDDRDLVLRFAVSLARRLARHPADP